MDKKNLLKEISYKLRQVRLSLHLSPSEMADSLNIWRSTYHRNEAGETPIKVTTLHTLAEKREISLDWLVCGKGQMHYEHKEINEDVPPKRTLDSLPGDVRELVEHIEAVPMLRYEVLLFFHNLKQEKKDMIADAMRQRT